MHFYIACLALVAFWPARLFAADAYSLQQKREIYAAAEFPRDPKLLVFSIKDPQWKDLEIDSLIAKLDCIEDKTATVLAASSVEFHFFCQPIKDRKILANRRAVFDELTKEQNSPYEALNALMHKLSDVEHVFAHLLELEHPQPPVVKPLSSLALEGSFIALATALNIPYAWRHFAFDWQSFRATQCNAVWLCAMVVIKAAGTLSVFYTNGQLIKNTVQQCCHHIKKSDSFVCDFAKAMRHIEAVMGIVKNSPILAQVYKNIDTFARDRTEIPELQAVIFDAEQRLNAEGHFFATLWQAKGSQSRYESIKKLREPFIALYYGLVRLDCMLAVVRIKREWERKGLTSCVAELDQEADKPGFCFEQLRNIFFANCIANDFNLQGNALISGPSTCGKSAAIRTITWAHIFGQSILLLPAKQARFAPVDTIATYFNVGDNISQNESSLLAQTKALIEMVELTKNHEAGKILLAIDEPYKGITSEMAEKLVAKLIRDLASKPTTLFLMSTHCKEALSVAEEENSALHNWQAEVKREGDEFIRTFVIKEGIPRWWFENIDEVAAFMEQVIKELTQKVP